MSACETCGAATPLHRDDCAEGHLALAVELERERVRGIVTEVWRMVPSGTDPYAAGFGLAVDEIAVRLQEAWGEEPTEAADWSDRAAPSAEGSPNE